MSKPVKKGEYQLSQLAQTHLLNIKNYTVTEFSESQWQIYKEKLLSGFEMLADNPQFARPCDDIFLGGFYFPVAKHTVYFTQEKGFILIVAVLGQSQLPQHHLG